MKLKPEGICTQLYRCPKCSHEMYQVPATPRYTPCIEHYCQTAHQVVELKPVPS